MTLLGLAGIIAASLIGPLLASPRRARVPIVVGELAVGVLLGGTGLRWVHPSDPVLTFLAQAGFALVMLIAGTHVPVGDPRLRNALRRGLLLAVGIGVVAVPIGAALSSMAHTQHTALYAVLLASSSAAVVMPIVRDEGLAGDHVLTLLAQVAVADTACIIALPLAADPTRAGRAAVGAVIVLAAAGLAFLVLRELADRNLISKFHAASVRHTFGAEMRVSLAALFALAGLAISVHVSVMLAGFALGLVLAAIGTPRRLASQLFAVTEGFLGPIFLIWLGASVDLRALAHHPRLLALAIGLTVATVAIHALGRLLGQPFPLAVLASAQLGVPLAAVALGTQSGLLEPGEGGAILAAAALTLGVAALCTAAARAATRRTATHAQLQSRTDPAIESLTDAAIEPPVLPPRPREPVATGRATERAPAVTERPPTPARSAKPAAPAATNPSARLATTPAARVATTPSARLATTKVEPTNVTPKANPAPSQAERPAPRPPTPNPASKPIVQSNVRVQPSTRVHPSDDASGRDVPPDR